MTKLTTGDDSTLLSYRRLSSVVFGNDSKATQFLDKKIAEAPDGENEEVIADERQMIQLLGHLHLQVDQKGDKI